MKGKILFSLSVYIFIFLCNVHASEELSMDDALSLAMQNNIKIIEAKKKIEISEAMYKNSRKFENPELDIDVGKIFPNLKEGSRYETKDLEGEVRLTQPLQMWGKKKLNVAIANDEKQQTENILQSIELRVSHDVKEQYLMALLAQKEVDLAMGNIEMAERFLEKVSLKYNEGKVRNHELSSAKLELANTKNDFLEATVKFNVALGNLNILIGRPTTSGVRLIGDLFPRDLKENFDQLIVISKKRRIDLLNIEIEISKKNKLIKLAKRDSLPDTNFAFFVEKEESVYSGGLGLSFELPLWKSSKQLATQALLEKEIVEITRFTLEREIELEVYTAYQNLLLARKVLDNSVDAINEADELLRLLIVEYQEGKATSLTYLDGLRSYKFTQKKYLNSLVSYADKFSELELAVGASLIEEGIK